MQNTSKKQQNSIYGGIYASAFFVLLLIFSLFCSGCSMLSGSDTVFFFTFHQAIPDNELVKNSLGIIRVQDLETGRQVPVRGVPLLSSAHIYAADILPDPSNPAKAGVRLYFDATGVNRWRQAGGYYTSEKLAMVIDGFFVRFIQLSDAMKNEASMVLPPIWSKEEAQAIVSHAPDNYKAKNH